MANNNNFSLTPALANPDVLDYSTREGQNIYRAATAPLASPFNVEPGELSIFLDQLMDRASECGWADVLDIPDDLENDPDGEASSILLRYGVITLENVIEHAETYIDQETRQAQNSAQLYKCIMDSLTNEGRSKIMLFSDDYTVEGIKSGAALLRVVIRESHIDTNATVRSIREQLSSLDIYMQSVSSDIEKFNLHVRSLLDKLQARGKATEDLLPNLFKGYKAASDRAFVEYIMRKEEDYDESIDEEAISYNKLMSLALNRYKVLKEKGRWNAPTDEQKKILALEAKLDKMSKSKASGNKPPEKKEKPTNEGSKTNNKKAQPNREKPQWMSVPPKEGEPKTKEIDGKVYHWCPKHDAWTRHTPQECKGKGYKIQKMNPPKVDEDKPKVKLQAALSQVTVNDDDDYE